MSDLQRILNSDPGAKRTGDSWMLRCPAHDDSRASLSVKESADGKALLHCFAGCSYDSIVSAFVESGVLESRIQGAGTDRSKPRWEQIYSYHSPDGGMVFQVLRGANKRFMQRRPDGKGGWIWNTTGIKKVLYRSRELAAHPRETVYVLEGEKDVDLACSLGLLATCNAGGAGKWTAGYSQQLANRNVVVIPDNDEPGRIHAHKVAGALREAKCRVKIVSLPGLPAKGDFTDWIRAGGTVEKLQLLETLASEASVQSPLKIISLADVEVEDVRWLWPGRIPSGKVTLISGDPNLGKSFLTLDIAARVSIGASWPDLSGVTTPGRVLLLNAEDDPADTVKPRLIAAGADVGRIDVLQGVEMPGSEDEPLLRLVSLEYDLQTIRTRLKDGNGEYRLVVIDPISAYMEGIDSNSNTEVRRLLTQIGAIAAETGCAFIVVSHLRKGGQGRAIHRTMGSLAFTAAARAVWTVILDPESTEPRRLFMPVKLNLVEEPRGLAYFIRDARCVWDDRPVDGTLEEIMAQAARKERPSRSHREERIAACADKLRERLSAGSEQTALVVKELKSLGFSAAHIACARKLVGVVAKRGGPREPWVMSLPDDASLYE